LTYVRFSRDLPPPVQFIAALATYSDHPAHMRVVKEFILPIKADIAALDYIV